jgi:hypothetical protein
VKTKIGILLVLVALCGKGAAQGFVNLNFESAQIIPIAGGPYLNSIAVSNALPGWSVFYGSSQQSVITYDAPALGSTFVTLWATNGSQLAGNYSALLQGGGTAAAATISQTGLVPASAQSLLFYGEGTSFPTSISVLVVSLSGQDLSLISLSSTANYTVYGANISEFAGQTETLAFSAPQISGNVNYWTIDNIQFSSSPVPEPSTLAFCALGGVFLVWRNRRVCSKGLNSKI